MLLEGPYSRLWELWLVLRAVADLVRGRRMLHVVGPCTTVFVSGP
jgi:hypothetical protein